MLTGLGPVSGAQVIASRYNTHGQADHAAEHREIAEALLQSQHAAKAAKQAEVDRLYRETRKGAA